MKQQQYINKTVIMWHACLVSCVYSLHVDRLVARLRDIIDKIWLGADSAASSRVGQIFPFRMDESVPYRVSLKYSQQQHLH